MRNISSEEIKEYWNKNPIGSTIIKFEPGSSEFFKHYDKLREKSESVEFVDKLHRFSEFVNKKVLDVGCGNGYILSKYAKAGAICYGVDVTEKAIEISKARFKLEGLTADFKAASAECLPFENNTFDLVCSMGVLHHAPDTQKAINEIYRVLKSEGEAILMLYYKNSAQYRLFFPIQALLKKKSVQTLLNEADGVGNPLGKSYTKSEAREMMKQFKNVKLNVDFLRACHFPFIWRFMPDKPLKPFARWLGFYLYITAEK